MNYQCPLCPFETSDQKVIGAHFEFHHPKGQVMKQTLKEKGIEMTKETEFLETTTIERRRAYSIEEIRELSKEGYTVSNKEIIILFWTAFLEEE